ncbi:hypothetical protein [Joostella sp.]|uniref:hypothetical protein n=1 Tax=Joostella sp. TaxID=2231138 RepID=UPI003A950E5A
MQQQLSILEAALNKGNGSLTIQESRSTANAFDSIIEHINNLTAQNKKLEGVNKDLRKELDDLNEDFKSLNKSNKK